MKSIVFAKRNFKEILRDKLNLGFGIGFPIIVLLLMTVINNNIPVDIFNINKLTPGIAVFGLAFISPFSGMLVAKDRTSSFTMRLFTSPMEAKDYIVGYILPLLPISIMQTIICYVTAIILGLQFNINVIYSILSLIPAAFIFIGIGLLGGSLLNEKQVSGLLGALLTNLTAWLSGAWFDLDLVGGAFKTIANLLPFAHCVNVARNALKGEIIFPDMYWVLGYAILFVALAIYAFKRKMDSME